MAVIAATFSQSKPREVRLYDWLNRFPGSYHIYEWHLRQFVTGYYLYHNCVQSKCTEDLRFTQPDSYEQIRKSRLAAAWFQLAPGTPRPPELA